MARSRTLRDGAGGTTSVATATVSPDAKAAPMEGPRKRGGGQGGAKCGTELGAAVAKAGGACRAPVALGSEGQDSHVVEFPDAGVASTAPVWSRRKTLVGFAAGWAASCVLMPIFTATAITSTIFEVFRMVLPRLDGRKPAEPEEGSSEDVTLVMPGLCGFLFHQLGMLQYICEHFDTTRLKLAGVSSGAMGALMVLHLERAAAGASSAAEASQRARAAAIELFGLLDKELSPNFWWPLGFLGRLGPMMDAFLRHFSSLKVPPPGRVRVGARRLSWAPLPAVVPDLISSFDSIEDMLVTLKASTSVWIVVRLNPFVWLRRQSAFYLDGVNPFSYFSFFDYCSQRWSGTAERCAPKHVTSGLDKLYAVWNCGAMRVILPRKGKTVWITPTVACRTSWLDVLHFSGWFMSEQWHAGYKQARELDATGYFSALTRRHLL